jgi:primosomal protein N' (replication factor Y) (superfamily II helicase)
MTRLASVAVPVPQVDLLTYRVPEGVDTPVPGARVLVPVGSRTVTGCVTGTDEVDDEDPRASAEGLRDVIDVLDGEAYVPPEVLALTGWVADYYACGPGEAVAAAAPPMAWLESRRVVAITEAGTRAAADGAAPPLSDLAQRVLVIAAAAESLPESTLRSRLDKAGTSRARQPLAHVLRVLEGRGFVSVSQVLEGEAVAYKTERVVELTAQGRDVAARAGEPGLRLGVRQRELIAALAAAPGGLPSSVLRDRGIDVAGLRRLGLKDLVSIRRQPVDRDPFAGPWGRTGAPPSDGADLALTAEQDTALERLRARFDQRVFHVALVHGVTGSGKTELYTRLTAHAMRAGRRALVLVPEIALTPGVAAAFRARFGGRVAIQHSGLSDGERHDQWQRIRRGDVDVVVGTRSAVFAPLRDIGLIVVDEEHDGSYKQDESPRYNGRDVAIVRGRQNGALVVLGSATPSMESYAHAKRGRYELLTLERRVMDRPLAAVRTVNMREEYAEIGPDQIVSRALGEAISERLARREQVLVLLNRRGFSTSVFCRQCGATMECPSCSVSLVVHGRGRAVCHYCNYARQVPRTCQHCGGPFLELLGFGTERVEAEMRRLFPVARVARLDRDTARRRGAVVETLARFGAGDLDVLVGTQMIAKGHDFPRVTLVGVISADVGLGLADFRSAERTFQLLTQVAGRAGRGSAAGEAIIQTVFPDHYSVGLACRQDYPAFFDQELAFRRAMRYPPVVALINGVVRAACDRDAMSAAGDLVDRIRGAGGHQRFVVLGPAPAPLARLRGEHRAQFFVKGPPSARADMRAAVVAALRDRPDLRRKTTIDIDPLSIL